MSDCLLVSPPLALTYRCASPREPPMLALYLAAVLRAAGLTPALLDLYHRGEAFCAALDGALRSPPRAIVVVDGDYTRSLPAESVAMASDRCRLRAPRIPLVLAGAGDEAAARRALDQAPALDAATFGEAEPVVGAVVDALRRGEPWRHLPGLVVRGDAGIEVNPDHPGIADLDALPFPAWDLLDRQVYGAVAHRHRRTPFFRVLGMRGCPWDCLFCDSPRAFSSRRGLRLRAPEAVVRELAWLVRTFGAREVQFIESVTNADDAHLARLCEALSEARLGLIWSCHVRVDRVTRAQLERMARAGCWNILFGVETSDPALLLGIRKRIDLPQARRAVAWAREVGITTTASFMLGLPGETPEQARRTIDFAVDLDPDFAQFFTTKLFRPDLVEAGLGQRFPGWAHDVHDIPGPPFLPTAYRSLGQLQALRREAYRRFYARPRFAARRLAGMLRDGEGLRAARAARSLLDVLRG